MVMKVTLLIMIAYQEFDGFLKSILRALKYDLENKGIDEITK